MTACLGSVTRRLRFALLISALFRIAPNAEESFPPFLTALESARGDLVIKLEVSQCAEVSRIGPTLQSKYPDHPFFLLWPFEATLVDFLCGHWVSLLEPKRYTFDHIREHIGKFAPADDGWGQRIRAQFKIRRERIAGAIRAEVRDEEQREFLVLYLESLFNRMTRNDDWIQHGINLRAEKWLERNPASPYREFVKSEIRYVRVASSLGIGASILAGGFLPLGRLGENLNRTMATGFALEFLYRKLWVRGILSSDLAPWLERSMTHDSLLWEAGGELAVTTVDLQVGVEVYRTPQLSFEPFVSYGALEMLNQDVEDSLAKRDDDRYNQTTPTFALGVQGNYWRGPSYRPQYGYLGVVLGYRFLQIDKRFPELEGNEIYLELHLGGKFRRQLRKND